MRQVLDETDRITDEHAWYALRMEGPHCGIKRGEEFIRDQHFASRESPHQGGFAGVRIADQRHASDSLTLLPPRAPRLALDIHRDDFLLKFGDTITDLASIQFSMRLTAPPATDTATLPPLRPRKLRRLAQARRHVAQPRDLPRCARGAGGRGAVETCRKALDLATQQNQKALVESIKAMIRLYEAGKPFREAQPPSPAHPAHP